MLLRFAILTFIFLVFFSCQENEQQIERGFYHWKSDFILSEEQQAFLKEIKADVLYVRYFDVDQGDYEPYPKAVADIVSKVDLPIVPTVYLTPDVFQDDDTTSSYLLAEKVARKIRAIHGDRPLTELQFDCDWAAKTKASYFAFLREMKHEFPGITISATVRLYQYKYPDIAGVPPVDKGLLMYYNMGELREYKETNSILNNTVGKQYLGFNTYPLPLDIALPNFKWALLFRKGQFEQICPNFTEAQLNDNELFSHTRNNWYIFKKDTAIGNTYFRFGDELRFEQCEESELLKAARLLLDEVNQKECRILTYDLQADTPKDYEKLDAVFSFFE